MQIIGWNSVVNELTCLTLPSEASNTLLFVPLYVECVAEVNHITQSKCES